MRRSTGFSLCLSGLLFVAASASAATLIRVPPFPGSSEMDVFGINNQNVITGSYFKDGVFHGFYGTLDGNYTSFDYATDGTEGHAINDNGEITGISNLDDSHCDYIPFDRAPDGSIKTIKNGYKALAGLVQGINSKGQFVGDYCQPDGSELGYSGKAGKYKNDIVINVDTTKTQPRGINKSGLVVGTFSTNSGNTRAFMLKNGVTSVIDYPDPDVAETSLEGINDKGVAVGDWENSDFVSQVFTYDTATSTFTPIVIPHADFARAYGINNSGLITISSDKGAFVYCPLKRSKCPAGGTEIVVHPVHVSPERFLHYERNAAVKHAGLRVPAGHRDADGHRH